MKNLKRFQDSRSLSIGHVERRAAEEALRAEYKSCHEQERSFNKKLPKRYARMLEQSEILEAVRLLCDLTGTKRVPKLVFSSDKVPKGAIGCWDGKKIHFLYCVKYLSVAIHELTHAMGCHAHDEEFDEIEQYLFDVFLSEVLPAWKLRDNGF